MIIACITLKTVLIYNDKLKDGLLVPVASHIPLFITTPPQIEKLCP